MTYLDQPLGIIHDGPEARDGRRKLLLEVADHEHGVLGGELAQLPQPRRCHLVLFGPADSTSSKSLRRLYINDKLCNMTYLTRSRDKTAAR